METVNDIDMSVVYFVMNICLLSFTNVVTTNNITSSSTNENSQRLITSTDKSQSVHLALMLTSVQVVETSVNVITDSPSQNYTQS